MSTCAVHGCDRAAETRGWCHAHYERQRRGAPLGGPILDTEAKRFWARVVKTDGCWLWTGATGGAGRYGRFANRQAHTYSYELAGGVVPAGQELDHLCRVTLCVRPDHLEPVTHQENVLRGESLQAVNARKTHCPRGHPYDETNTVRTASGRACRACRRAMFRRNAARYNANRRARYALRAAS